MTSIRAARLARFLVGCHPRWRQRYGDELLDVLGPAPGGRADRAGPGLQRRGRAPGPGMAPVARHDRAAPGRPCRRPWAAVMAVLVLVMGIPDRGRLPTPRQGPAGWHIDLEPDHNGRQAVREPAHRPPQRYDHVVAHPPRHHFGGTRPSADGRAGDRRPRRDRARVVRLPAL